MTKQSVSKHNHKQPLYKFGFISSLFFVGLILSKKHLLFGPSVMIQDWSAVLLANEKRNLLIKSMFD